MALQTEAQWKEFFTTASIPEAASQTYAKAFFDNGFSELSLPLLDKQTLTEVGITVIGHQLSILQCAKSRTNNTTSITQSSSKASVNTKLMTLTL